MIEISQAINNKLRVKSGVEAVEIIRNITH